MTRFQSKIGLVQFPGSNCDQDCSDAFRDHFNLDLIKIWHEETTIPKVDGLILPGGFSYGDYLRAGSLASHSPIMMAVKQYAQKGGSILGICNGFQILTEAQLLSGTLLPNINQQFICKFVELETVKGSSGYHTSLRNQILKMPIAHGEGRFYIAQEPLKKLEDQQQILFRYTENPNGSTKNIAGIISENGRIMGLMPHPERATDQLLGGSRDGLKILETFLESCL